MMEPQPFPQPKLSPSAWAEEMLESGNPPWHGQGIILPDRDEVIARYNAIKQHPEQFTNGDYVRRIEREYASLWRDGPGISLSVDSSKFEEGIVAARLR